MLLPWVWGFFVSNRLPSRLDADGTPSIFRWKITSRMHRQQRSKCPAANLSCKPFIWWAWLSDLSCWLRTSHWDSRVGGAHVRLYRYVHIISTPCHFLIHPLLKAARLSLRPQTNRVTAACVIIACVCSCFCYGGLSDTLMQTMPVARPFFSPRFFNS